MWIWWRRKGKRTIPWNNGDEKLEEDNGDVDNNDNDDNDEEEEEEEGEEGEEYNEMT